MDAFTWDDPSGDGVRIAILMPDDDVRAAFVPPEAAAAMAAVGQVRWNDMKRQYTPEELTDVLAGVDICVTGWGFPRLDEATLAKADRLRLVAHTGGSVAAITSPALYDRGIRVVSGNWVYAESVAEGTLAYMLSALRRIPYYSTAGMCLENWGHVMRYSQGLLDQTVGLAGFGTVARYLVPMLRAFRVNVVAYDPFVPEETFAALGVRRCDTLEELFSACPIISLHLSLTPETYGLIGRDLLARMPDGGVLVNTARGQTVDEAALAQELRSGRLRAALDVYAHEPLAEDSPLRGLDNALLMPHMAGPTGDRSVRVGLALAEDMANLLAGRPLVNELVQAQARKMTQELTQPPEKK